MFVTRLISGIVLLALTVVFVYFGGVPLLAILVLLSESLIDNFIFHFHHTFHYSITLAVAFRLYENEEKELALSSR